MLSAWGGSFGGVALADGSASLGECTLSGANSTGYECPWNSVPFVFGVPQTLTLTLSANAWAESYTGGPGDMEMGGACGGGFAAFFDTGGQPMDGVTYTFVPVNVPEPGTLGLCIVAGAVLLGFHWRRQSH